MELLVFYIPSFVITLSWWCLLGNQKETENKKTPGEPTQTLCLCP